MLREIGFPCSFLRHNMILCELDYIYPFPKKYRSQAQKHLQASPCKMFFIFCIEEEIYICREEESGKIPFRTEEMNHHTSVLILLFVPDCLF